GSYHPAAGEFQVGLGQLQQRVLLQDAVHINTYNVWVPGVVDADVQGIALAAVDFVNDGEFLERRVSRPVDLPNCLGGQASLDLIVHSLQFVGGYHQFKGPVFAAVVHHYHLVVVVVEGKQRLDVLLDAQGLVIGRGDEGEVGRQVGMQDDLIVDEAVLLEITPH